MATSVHNELKKNVLDEVQYKNKPLALAMLTFWLWVPFWGMTALLFYLAKINPEAGAHYDATAVKAQVEQQLIEYNQFTAPEPD